MNLIARGELAQRNWRMQHLTDDAVYARGALTANVKATKGSTRTTVTSSDGAMQAQSRIVDFIIDVDQLTSFGEPRVGDRVLHLGNTYEVCHGIDGVRAWAWSGRDNLTYRIHTLQVPTQILTASITTARANKPIEEFEMVAAVVSTLSPTYKWTLKEFSVGRTIVATWNGSWTVTDTQTGPLALTVAEISGNGASFSFPFSAIMTKSFLGWLFPLTSSVELQVTAGSLIANDTHGLDLI